MYLCADDTCAGTEGQVGICNVTSSDGRAWTDSSRRPGAGDGRRVTGQFVRRAYCRDAVIPALPAMLICFCAVAAGLLFCCFREHEARGGEQLSSCSAHCTNQLVTFRRSRPESCHPVLGTLASREVSLGNSRRWPPSIPRTYRCNGPVSSDKSLEYTVSDWTCCRGPSSRLYRRCRTQLAAYPHSQKGETFCSGRGSFRRDSRGLWSLLSQEGVRPLRTPIDSFQSSTNIP